MHVGHLRSKDVVAVEIVKGASGEDVELLGGALEEGGGVAAGGPGTF